VQEITIGQPRQGASAATVKLDVPVGELLLADSESAELLIEGTIRLPDGVELEQDCRLRGDELLCSLGARHKRKLDVGFKQSPRWRLRVSRGIPLDLRVETGAGEAQLDLSALTITNLDVEAGVGKTVVSFPRRGQLRARVKAGVGETIVGIPQGLGARIRITTGIGAIHVSNRFQKLTNAYESPDYELASERVDLRVEAGVGHIAVESIG